jgi:hypothetical protein
VNVAITVFSLLAVSSALTFLIMRAADRFERAETDRRIEQASKLVNKEWS